MQNILAVDPNGPLPNLSALAHTRSAETPPAPIFQLGDQVIVGNRRRLRGTIRYFGPTAFAAGDWVGMELEVPEGKNDGTVKVIATP